MLDLMAELAKPGKHEDYDYTVLHRLQTELGSCVARLIWFDKQNALYGTLKTCLPWLTL